MCFKNIYTCSQEPARDRKEAALKHPSHRAHCLQPPLATTMSGTAAMSNITAEAENENMSAPQRPMLKAYRKYDAEYRRYFQEQMHKLSSDGNNVIMTKGIPLLRLKKLMKTQSCFNCLNIARDVPALMAYGVQIFVRLMTRLAWSLSVQADRRNTLMLKDLLSVYKCCDKFSFLVDLVIPYVNSEETRQRLRNEQAAAPRLPPRSDEGVPDLTPRVPLWTPDAGTRASFGLSSLPEPKEPSRSHSVNVDSFLEAMFSGGDDDHNHGECSDCDADDAGAFA